MKVMRRLLGTLLVLFSGAGAARAQSPCGAVPDHIIAIYMKGTTAEDKARLRQSFALLQKIDSQALDAFERVIVVDLANTPVDELSGVANPKHWVRATSGWTSDPALLQRYIAATDFFRDASGRLKPGLARQASTPRSTTNMRRVAGGAGSKAEAWEVVSAHEMVLRGYFARDEVVEFGLKIGLTGGGEVEADVWVLHNTGEKIEKLLLDQKHTIGDQISTINDDLIARWIRGLENNDFDRVLIPTNEPPSGPLVTKIQNALATRNPPIAGSRIEFVTNLSAF